MTESRSAFSLLEMTVVIGAVTLLSGMTAPGIFRALRQGSVNDAGQAVKMTAELAQGFAMRAGPQVMLDGAAWGDGLKERYGVKVVPAEGSEAGYVVLLRGKDEASPRRALSNTVDLRTWTVAKPAIVSDTTDLKLMSGEQTWWYAWRTGLPVDGAGAPLASPVSFTIATRDYQVATSGGTTSAKGLASEVTLYLRTGVVRAQ